MQNPQTATAFFFAPVAAAYLLACAGWLAFDRFAALARDEREARSERPYLDFVLCLAVAGGIFALGAAYRNGWLLPTGRHWSGRCGWLVDNLIIYSPIAAVLAVRRQSAATVFLSARRLPEKIVLGMALGAAGVSLYSALRGEAAFIPSRLLAAVHVDKLVDFVPVFLEGVAMAFGFVRFRWLAGTAAALAVPAVLFALAHVPGRSSRSTACWPAPSCGRSRVRAT
jgi:hypothetical protein